VAPAPAAPAADAEPLLPASEPPVPTPEEAAQQAEAAITEANADAEFEKLKEELEDGD
jgi:hypothetical protein